MREFLSCNFYNSKDNNDPRGQNCDDKLETMMTCIQKHADYYKEKMSGDPEDEEEDPFAINENEDDDEVSSSHIDVTSSIVKDKEKASEAGTTSWFQMYEELVRVSGIFPCVLLLGVLVIVKVK